MIEIGRVCLKLAGRDSNQLAVVVEVIDDKYVMIDGNVRRRKCNILHLEPTEKTLKIAKGAETKAVQEAMKKEGLEVLKKGEKKAGKTKTEKPKKQKVAKPKAEKKVKKEVVKKEEKVKKEDKPAKEVKKKAVKKK